MKTVAMPPRSGHSQAEIVGFHADRDRELAALRAHVSGVLATASLPPRVLEILQATVPVLVEAASALARKLHLEAPGGPSLTHAELGHLASAAAHEIERRIAVDLAHLVTEPPAILMDGGPAPTDAAPTPAIDPGVVTSGTVTPAADAVRAMASGVQVTVTAPDPAPAPAKASRAKATMAPDTTETG